MLKERIFTCALLTVVLSSTPVRAQSPVGAAEGSLYGRPYVAIAIDVKPALPSRSAEPWFPSLAPLVIDPPSLRPEALAFRDGLLYVGGDWNETQNQIAVFTTNYWGELTFSHSIQSPISNPPPLALPNDEWWGPEGFTFNTGSTGIGAGASLLVSVDDLRDGIAGATMAAVHPVTGALSNWQVVPSPDDIAYGPMTQRFYLLANPTTIHVYTSGLVPTGQTINAPTRARGITVVSPAFARELTGDESLTGDVILVACMEDVAAVPSLPNRIAAFRSDGSLIGDVQSLPWLNGASGVPIEPHEVEAIAVDELNRVIYLGDESQRVVYALRQATSEIDAAVGPVFGRDWSARGHYVELGLASRSGEPWYPSLAGQMNDPPRLRPEGLAWRNGRLYASGDWNETQNQVAVFDAAADGSLSLASAIQLPVSEPPPGFPNNELWGPEGLTFNANSTGYGGGGSLLITVEDYQASMSGNTLALLDGQTGALSGFGLTLSADDIAHAPLRQRFYLLVDPDVMQEYTQDDPPAFTGVQFPLIRESKGAAVISPAFAQFLLSDPAISTECLLVVAKRQVGSQSAPTNRMAVYTPDGALLAVEDMTWTRDALPGQPLQEFEAVAVDEVNQVIYIGDEKAGGILALSAFHCGAPGDTNGDGLLNGGDVQGFVDVMLGGGTTGQVCASDFNGDSIINDSDLTAFVAVLVGP